VWHRLNIRHFDQGKKVVMTNRKKTLCYLGFQQQECQDLEMVTSIEQVVYILFDELGSLQ
jgi:hypothetical protein